MQHVFDFSTIAAGSQVGIQVSSIPDAGRGLFTYKDVREGRTIGEYFGMDVIRDHDYGDLNDIIASYSMGNHDSSHIYCAFSIGTRTMLCMMGYTNDPLDDLMCNVRPVWNGDRCRIVATRDIVAGEEFLMAYGDIFWMRDIWPSGIIERAWQNYGTRRTNAAWTEVYQRRIARELESDTDDSEVSEVSGEEQWQDDWEDEEGAVFRERIVIDLTGEEPVESVERVAVVQEEGPVFIPYTLDSPELYEDYIIIRNSCA